MSDETKTDFRLTTIERSQDELWKHVNAMNAAIQSTAVHHQSIISRLERQDEHAKTSNDAAEKFRAETHTDLKEIKTLLVGDGKTDGHGNRLACLEKDAEKLKEKSKTHKGVLIAVAIALMGVAAKAFASLLGFK